MTAHPTSRVSIALCTYNGENYLRAQLDSLLAQQYQWFEMIAVDDCSTDGTATILEEYQAKEPRIKVFRNSVNIGSKQNFLKAMRLCTGNFIAPCDQDDIWSPDKISHLLSMIGNHSLVYCDSQLISATGESLKLKMSDLVSMISTTDPSSFLFSNCVSGHASLFRSDILTKISSIPDCFNYDWWLAAVAASIDGVKYTPRCLVKHRQHQNNTTNFLCDRELLPKQPKIQGYKLQALRNAERNIAALASLSGKHQRFLVKLDKLWRARESKWISAGLAWQMLRHGLRLHAPQKQLSFFFLMKLTYSFFWGIRAKQFVSRFAYKQLAT